MFNKIMQELKENFVDKYCIYPTHEYKFLFSICLDTIEIIQNKYNISLKELNKLIKEKIEWENKGG